MFTGDLVDREKGEMKSGITLMKELVSIAPVYYVTGNHEAWFGSFSVLEEKLEAIGVRVLRNTTERISIGDEYLRIVGLDDPAFERKGEERDIMELAMEHYIDGIEVKREFTILLAHRPEMIDLYANYGSNLVFSGHAHGGQFRIPFIGRGVAPNQGFFPTYTNGEHTVDETTMIVNRGLGNSIIPIRIFNRPEITIVKLESIGE
ncbi:metallophosphoesterase [Oceanobacillus senegalensis]|uniref:metallophosphoesterase n=1 Tax=Oceanobacillus senegalensis TaxID=1936063 RepID=UPI001FE66881|nr:metallophosphoesterase [Oceanobacillus senegalensis]